ncbi:hypothetical protein N8590_01070 [bacterium]|nr:hypothetical protein [bacterium]
MINLSRTVAATQHGRSLSLMFSALMLGVFTCSGCGGGPAYDGETRFEVSGEVSIDDAPLATGIIAFVPDDATKRTVSAPISDGKYFIPEGKGPNAGLHKVVVSGKEEVATIDDDETPPENEELIEEDEDGDVPEPPSGLAKFVLEGNIVAPSFNLETQLTAQVEKNSAFNFEVTSIDE